MQTNEEEELRQLLDRDFGLRNVRSEWLRRQTSFTSTDELRPIICRTDLCTMSHGTLPWDVSRAHAVPLGVVTLMQVDDVINIASADPRALSSNPRVFQATLTDGANDIVAVELHTPPSPQFVQAAAVPGAKLKIHASARVRRGRILLRSSDYTVLGAPPSNVWGPLYNQEISAARRSAGLPDHAANAQASLGRVLDNDNPANASLVWNGDSSDPSALPLNIGGIADPALLAAAEEAENGVVVSQSQTQPLQSEQETVIVQAVNQSGHSTLPQGNLSTRQDVTNVNIGASPVQAMALTSPTFNINTISVTNNVTGNSSAPRRSFWNQQSSVHSKEYEEESGGRQNIGGELEIPDVPDSDEENGWAALVSTQEDGPKGPFGRLCDVDAAVVRAYSVGSRGGTNGTILDDGFAVRAVTFGQEMVGRLSEVAGLGAGRSGGEGEEGSLRAATRGVCGFMSLRRQEGKTTENGTEVYDMGAVPPDANVEETLNDYLKAVADNVEGRLVKSLIDGEL